MINPFQSNFNSVNTSIGGNFNNTQAPQGGNRAFCTFCNRSGHTTENCFKKPGGNFGAPRFNNISEPCSICGRTNHRTDQCRMRATNQEPCTFCGKTNHPSERCHFRNGRPVPPPNPLSQNMDSMNTDYNEMGQTNQRFSSPRGSLFCSYCGRQGHTEDRCFSKNGRNVGNSAFIGSQVNTSSTFSQSQGQFQNPFNSPFSNSTTNSNIPQGMTSQASNTFLNPFSNRPSVFPSNSSTGFQDGLNSTQLNPNWNSNNFGSNGFQDNSNFRSNPFTSTGPTLDFSRNSSSGGYNFATNQELTQQQASVNNLLNVGNSMQLSKSEKDERLAAAVAAANSSFSSSASIKNQKESDRALYSLPGDVWDLGFVPETPFSSL